MLKLYFLIIQYTNYSAAVQHNIAERYKPLVCGFIEVSPRCSFTIWRAVISLVFQCHLVFELGLGVMADGGKRLMSDSTCSSEAL